MMKYRTITLYRSVFSGVVCAFAWAGMGLCPRFVWHYKNTNCMVGHTPNRRACGRRTQKCAVGSAYGEALAALYQSLDLDGGASPSRGGRGETPSGRASSIDR